ncbi:MAG: hypothetical protein IJA47_04670 [Oscillospiraceae bacterium]|nr:hypothetical protein [Oscillospiraceae bacterium]
MKIPNCYDPVEQERRRDLAYNAKIMRLPCCQGCGQRITSEQYLDLEPFGLKGYACEKCVSRHTFYTDDLEEN